MAKNPTPRSRATGENPRTTRIRDIVLPAVIELLLAEGAGAVTALRVSEHAGVARSTIYQHWPDQQALLLDAIDRIITPHVPTSITDNLEDDLTPRSSPCGNESPHGPFGPFLQPCSTMPTATEGSLPRSVVS